MDVREKLVELLDVIIQPGQKTLGDIADHLIAHGVTIANENNVIVKRIDLVGKCGSCRYFNAMENTANGECLKSPYSDDVAHDPEHPYRIVTRSKGRCVHYLMRMPEPPKGE